MFCYFHAVSYTDLLWYHFICPSRVEQRLVIIEILKEHKYNQKIERWLLDSIGFGFSIRIGSSPALVTWY